MRKALFKEQQQLLNGQGKRGVSEAPLSGCSGHRAGCAAAAWPPWSVRTAEPRGPGSEGRRNEEVTMLSNAVTKLTVIVADTILYQHVYEEVMEETIAENFKTPKIALCQL